VNDGFGTWPAETPTPWVKAIQIEEDQDPVSSLIADLSFDDKLSQYLQFRSFEMTNGSSF